MQKLQKPKGVSAVSAGPVRKPVIAVSAVLGDRPVFIGHFHHLSFCRSSVFAPISYLSRISAIVSRLAGRAGALKMCLRSSRVPPRTGLAIRWW
jgi:hypothetical protein